MSVCHRIILWVYFQINLVLICVLWATMLRGIFGLQKKEKKLKPKFHEELHGQNQISSRNSQYNSVLWSRKLKSCICVTGIFQARVSKEAWKGRTGGAPRVNFQTFDCRSSFPPLRQKKLKLHWWSRRELRQILPVSRLRSREVKMPETSSISTRMLWPRVCRTVREPKRLWPT